MNPSGKMGIRRFLPLILLATVLMIATAFVLLLPVIQEKIPAKDAANSQYVPTYQTIDERDPKTLQSITISHLDGETYTLVRRDDTLALEQAGGEPEPIDAMIANSFLKYATEISVEDTVTQDESEVLENLPDMGLQPPQIKAEVTYADGSIVTISLGYNLPSTSYYYYQWSGDDGVYLCNSGVYEIFEYTADMLLSVAQPPIIRSLIERVSILHGDGSPIVCTFASDGGDEVVGMLESPFRYPMDSQAADTLLSAVQNFRLGARLTPVTEENAALYGLDAPQAVVKIAQREGLYSQIDSEGILQSAPLASSGITLTIGGKDGEFFYYCEYEGTCYRVSGFLAAAFLKADAMNYLSLNPADMGGETMQSVVVQTGDGTLNIRAAYTENVLPNNELETDKYGNIVYTVDVTANGEAISADAFDSLVGRLRQMAVSGRLETLTEPGGTPRWQMTLTTVQGRSRTLATYPLDAFRDVLAVDGVALFDISNEALEIALGEFAALPEPTEIPSE